MQAHADLEVGVGQEHKRPKESEKHEKLHQDNAADLTFRGAQQSNSHTYSANGFTNPNGGVNVKNAEANFAELSKELSWTSHRSRMASRPTNERNDVEKFGSSDQEPFDLAQVLRGAKGKEEQAGIKSKKIGVIWDGLTVRGIGGVKNFVSVSA